MTHLVPGGYRACKPWAVMMIWCIIFVSERLGVHKFCHLLLSDFALKTLYHGSHSWVQDLLPYYIRFCLETEY